MDFWKTNLFVEDNAEKGVIDVDFQKSMN